MNETVTTTSTTFHDLWTHAASGIVNFVEFLLILVVGYFVATMLGKAVDKILQKLGFDRMIERTAFRNAMSTSKVKPSDILGKVIFYSIFLFVLQMAFGVFGPNPISNLITRVIAFLPNVFVAIAIVVIAASIATAVKNIIKDTLGGLSYGSLLANLAALSIVVVGAFAALSQLNIAPAIVNGLFYAMLAIIVGVSVVAIGGAGIQPLRSRWETALSAIEQEVPRATKAVSSSASTTVIAAPAPVTGTAPFSVDPRSDSQGYVS